MADSKFSRRDFMKVTGAGTAGFVRGLVSAMVICLLRTTRSPRDPSLTSR